MGRGQMPFLGQAVRVLECRARHADCLCGAGHAPGECGLAAADGLADCRGRSVWRGQRNLFGPQAQQHITATCTEWGVQRLIVDATGLPVSVLDITRVAAGLNMDVFEVGALYQIAEESEGDGEENSYVVSGAFKIDRVKLKAQYGMVDGDQTDNEGTQYAFGADYKLAKNSKVYAYFNELTYEDGTTGDEEEERTLGVGMEHKF
mgnify:CR=1 FL=1